MEPQYHRIVNGLLKADLGLISVEDAQARLAQNVVIRADPLRMGPNDLWPAVWFLAAVLERQFSGAIRIDAGLKAPYPSPIPLGPRCSFERANTTEAKGISVWLESQHNGIGAKEIFGDTRSNELSCARPLDSLSPAHPIGCCALAGYLGFAALTHAVGIPPYHSLWRQATLILPFNPDSVTLPPRFAVLGTGQVGQAFLALGYFLSSGTIPSVHLVDKDEFEDYNYATQVLLSDDMAEWLGKPKVEYLSGVCQNWGWKISAEQTEIKWGWRFSGSQGTSAFLGFDNMDARRIGAESGFEWLVECGVGTDFLRPRVTWHSIPPNRQMANVSFPTSRSASRQWSDSTFARSLGDTPGSCGRVFFENIEASAPSLGLVGASFAWSELLNFLGGRREALSGTAYVSRPFLPFDSESLADPEISRGANEDG
jgi:hypothetical protein